MAIRKDKLARTISLGLATLLLGSALAACGGGGDTPTEGSKDTTKTTEGAKDTDEATDPDESKDPGGEESPDGELSYPLEGGTLTHWLDLNSNVSANYVDLGETPYAEELMRLTGVTVKFEHPLAGQAQDQLTAMTLTQDFPDIMEYNWLASYPGGPQKAIDDGVVLKLNDIFEDYAPDLMAYLKANPEDDKQIRTDEGNYYAFPFIREDDAMAASFGPMARGDWMEELGIEIPKTFDELEAMLVAFKEEKGATSPYSMEFNTNNVILYSSGTTAGFQLDKNGNVEYGPMTDAYKLYLETMHDWYKKGLLDQDFATIDRAQLDSKITTGLTGMTNGWNGSGMGAWNLAGQATDETFELVPIGYVTVDGSKSEFGYLEHRYGGGGSAAITTSASDVELAAKYLNFGYTEAGYALNNFGIEGVSYNKEGDNYVYTDIILNNPDGWPIGQAMGAHLRAAYNGQFIQSLQYQDQYFATEPQKNAPALWSGHGMADRRLPNVTPTSEESSELATIMNDIQTYRDEMTLSFILGNEPLDNFDAFVKQIEQYDIARAIEIQEAAIERFQNR